MDEAVDSLNLAGLLLVVAVTLLALVLTRHPLNHDGNACLSHIDECHTVVKTLLEGSQALGQILNHTRCIAIITLY